MDSLDNETNPNETPSCNKGGGNDVEYIRKLLQARADVLLTTTIVRDNNNATITGMVAFLNDNAVGIATAGGQIAVIPLDAINEVR